MPGLDGTGPRGEGPMTGGARGYCNPGYAGYGAPYGYGRGYGLGWGRGFRGGFGAGFGWGRGYGYGRGYYGSRGTYPPPGGWYGSAYNAPYRTPYGMKPEDEVNMLKNEASAIKDDLDAINKRIEDIESQSSESSS